MATSAATSKGIDHADPAYRQIDSQHKTGTFDDHNALHGAGNRQPFDAEDFGPMGTSNDTATIQAAIDALDAEGGGEIGEGEVVVRGRDRTVNIEGTLRIGRRTKLVVDEGVELRRTTSTIGPVVRLQANTAKFVGRVRLRFGRFVEFGEMADPTVPAINKARLFVRDSPTIPGKTELAVRFATGAIQVVASEP